MAIGFMQGPLTRWTENVKKLQVTPKLDRKYDLWVHDVELTFTMNEDLIRNVFSFLAKNAQGTDDKAYNEEIVVMSDLLWFFRDQLKYKLRKKDLQAIFGESKMSVLNEQEKTALLKYRQLQYVEFLEFIARLATKIFERSEYEERSMNEKIELLLDEVFSYFNFRRVKQEIKIEVFSDSDSDY